MRKILKYVAIALVVLIVAGGVAFYVASRPDIARFSTAELSGRVPVMASQRPEQFPTMKVLEATGWPAGEAPRAADGLTVARFAEGLDHPRSMLVLPNGDVLVAEAQSPPRKDSGIEGKVMKSLMGKAGAVAATRRARAPVVMARSDKVEFHVPVRVGELIELAAHVARVGRSSMTVVVEVTSEGLVSGRRRLAVRGSFEMVAVDAEGRPVPITHSTPCKDSST